MVKGAFDAQSDGKASDPQLAQPASHTRRGVVRCRSGSIRWQDARQIPDPRTVGDQLEEHPWPGAPFGGEALAVRHAEIATGDGGPRQADVALDQLGLHWHLHAAERRTVSKMTGTQRGSRARWRSFTSPLAITTSKASSFQRDHAGSVVSTAGKAPSNSDRIRSTQARLTLGSL
jgi:hypothetical protein